MPAGREAKCPRAAHWRLSMRDFLPSAPTTGQYCWPRTPHDALGERIAAEPGVLQLLKM